MSEEERKAWDLYAAAAMDRWISLIFEHNKATTTKDGGPITEDALCAQAAEFADAMLRYRRGAKDRILASMDGTEG